MPDFPVTTSYTVKARFDLAKARIKAAHDDYELLLQFTIEVAKVYEGRTGKELKPTDTFTAEDEAAAYTAVAAQGGSRA
jgi:hypothetical protein